MDRAAFVQDLIGRPYRLGAQGPDEFDCWSLVRHVQSELYGRSLAPVEVVEDDALTTIRWFTAMRAEFPRWTEIDAMEDGCLVSMSRAEERNHSAVFLDMDGGLVLHTSSKAGVYPAPLCDLRAVGWGRFRFWRFTGNAPA